MTNPVWNKAIKASAEPPRAKQGLESLAATSAGAALAKMSAEQARVLATLFSGSQALGNALVAHPDWLESLTPETLQHARRKQGLRNEVNQWLKPLLEAGDFAGALKQVREFKQREMLRIGACDLARLGNVSAITLEISDVADVCLDTVWQVCLRQLTQRYGRPYHQDMAGRWRPTESCVLGLGKLGGQELNYSSDVDVVFVYSEEGQVFKDSESSSSSFSSSSSKAGAESRTRTRTRTTGSTEVVEIEASTKPSRPVMSNHQFFNRLAEAFIAEITRMAPEGMLYRIDLRLRPEGDAGPLTRSLAGYENYYAQWGQTWERMMLIKARGVAGDESLAAEFVEMVQPFRYPRSINQRVLSEVGAMKDRIENEVVKAGELERNVKLGRGGIREIEFIAQSLQLLHAGRQPFLQGAQTLPCLDKLVQYELLPAEGARMLQEAYCFLREVEHRLQMEDNRQTHTLPAERPALERLARLMGCATAKAFEAARRRHTDSVRRWFDEVLKSEVPPAPGEAPFPRQFAGAEAEWKRILADHAFKDPDKAFRVLREFVEGPGYIHVSPRTSELAYRLLPRLFRLCKAGVQSPESRVQSPKSAEDSPQSTVQSPPAAGPGQEAAAQAGERRSPTRRDGGRWGRAGSETGAPPLEPLRPETERRPSVEAPLSDPDRVVTRLDSFISAYGARSTLFELWSSNPTIFDLLLLLFDRSEFLAELAIRTPDLVDELVTSGRLRQRKSAEETLRDLRHGLADADQYLWLRRYHQAELMRIGLRDILGLADFEQYLTELSALAEACLQYALEVVMRRHRLKAPPFVVIGMGKLGGAEIDYGSDLDIVFVAEPKAKNLPKLSRLAVEVMELLSSRTEQGIVFHTDARLRPDGEKSLMVNTLKAYEEYYRQRAQLWEIQALTRARPVAGDLKLGAQFRVLVAALTNFRQPSLPLAAFTPDWRQKIHLMRLRIEKERTPRGKDELAIKTGIGGLVDAEFIAQALCLAHGWQEPNTLRALERGREAGALPEAEKFIHSYRRLRRVEGILRRWSYEGESVLPDDPAPYYRVSVRCGLPTPEAFRQTMAEYRRTIREVYTRVFQV